MTLLFHSFMIIHVRNDRNFDRNTHILLFQYFHLVLCRASLYSLGSSGVDGRGILGAIKLLNGHLQPCERHASELELSMTLDSCSDGRGLKRSFVDDT